MFSVRLDELLLAVSEGYRKSLSVQHVIAREALTESWPLNVNILTDLDGAERQNQLVRM